MGEFIAAVFRFITSQGFSDGETNKVLIFTASCGILGTLAMLMDLRLFGMQKTSLFNFKYTTRSVLPILLCWTIGAAIGGFFGQIFNVLQVSLLACATAGIGWPARVTKLIKDKTEANRIQPNTGVTGGSGVAGTAAVTGNTTAE